MKFFRLVFNYIFNNKNLIKLRFYSCKPKYREVFYFPKCNGISISEYGYEYLVFGYLLKTNK